MKESRWRVKAAQAEPLTASSVKSKGRCVQPGAEKSPYTVCGDFEEDRFGPKHGPTFKLLHKKHLKKHVSVNLE